MSSELLLLTSLIIAIQVAMPIGTYLLFNGRYDDKTRLWLLSMSIISVSTILVSIRPLIPYYLSHELPWMLHSAGFLLMVEVIRREKHVPAPWWIYGIVLGALAITWNTLQVLGYSESWGLALYSSFVSMVCCVLWWMLHKLCKQNPSKSLLLLEIGVVLYGFPSMLRVLAFLYLGTSDTMNVYKFSFFTNLLVFSFVLAVLFIALGYWGFTLEKSERERKLAEAGEGVALESAEHFRQLVQERDHLLVMNSRFSAVSALSSFSAMLIHDISQPLQTLQLGLERIHARLSKGASSVELGEDIKHLEQASDRAGLLVMSLRNLMKSGESQTVPVLVKPLFDRVKGILDSETLQKKASIRMVCDLRSEYTVLCEPTMLQRILINLVSNSLNQFQVNPVVSPEVVLRLTQQNHHDVPGMLIEVIDNGGGFQPEVLERVGQPWSSNSPDGLGLALVLSKQLLSLWDGDFMLQNRDDGFSGAIVKLWLRQAA